MCCHAHRINHLWQETESLCRERVTMEPQTFCSLEKIKLKAMNKNLVVCNNYTINNYVIS